MKGHYYTSEQAKLEIKFSSYDDKPLVNIDGKYYPVINYSSKVDNKNNPELVDNGDCPELVEESNRQLSFGF